LVSELVAAAAGLNLESKNLSNGLSSEICDSDTTRAGD